ncbi:MAG: hypothetical protein VX835_04690 [Pseudomonadota bacterium]|nr:hypothetical protein [Pseudomonadota bacterium]
MIKQLYANDKLSTKQLNNISFEYINKLSDNTIRKRFLDNEITFEELGNIKINARDDEDNTHVDAIEDSASESASRLKKNFAHLTEGKFGQIFEEIENMLSSMKEKDTYNSKLHYSKEGLNDIRKTELSDDKFVDKKSCLTVGQLLCLAFVALKDKYPNDDTATTQISEILYHFKRGYNLDEFEIDDGNKISKEICARGQFNKIIEKTVGFLEESDSVMVCPQTCIFKIKALIEQTIDTDFFKRPKNEKISNYQALLEIINDDDISDPNNDHYQSVKNKLFSTIEKDITTYYGEALLPKALGSNTTLDEYIFYTFKDSDDLSKKIQAKLNGINNGLFSFGASPNPNVEKKNTP